MPRTAALPGLTSEVVRPAAGQSPLRTDVAGFIGRTRRGPVGEPVRVSGWRDLTGTFGGLDARFLTGYALRGYTQNGGQVAHVLRLGGDGAASAHTVWEMGDVAGQGFLTVGYRIEAISPGTWANGTRVTVSFRAAGGLGHPEVDLRVEVPGEPPERFAGSAPADLAARLDGDLRPAGGSGSTRPLPGSRFIRLIPEAAAPPAATGPSVQVWDDLVLGGGADPVPGPGDYLDAVARLGDLVEVALVVLPDLHPDLGPEAPGVLDALLRDAVTRQDRLVLIDVPASRHDPDAATGWVAGLLAGLDGDLPRAGAVYHPWVRVDDPLGRTAIPLRDVPPSGHVAGLASRLDRERGAQHTPANALLHDVVDLAAELGAGQQALIYAAVLNPLRCRPSRGLEIWGGRTLDTDPARCFVAHRRLLHRLVRAIRRVAEPLVFEPNGPVLRFTLVRGVSSILLAAWRAGGLAGATPEEAFQVRCDEGNNPPDLVDLGRLECEIKLAPAAPMEFIRLLLVIAPGGALEVVEA